MAITIQVGLSSGELMQRLRLNLSEDQDRLPFARGSSRYQGASRGMF